ncbi:ABC transporter permease [Xylanivirga thermophila]|uniref:ABC transporter permease n=1 Tax=Xylanivirga thermophila TaxID=2496273 RepID=UPI00101C5B2D|nr:ABC transporter permease subunit [Xylanivirga thermophila]
MNSKGDSNLNPKPMWMDFKKQAYLQSFVLIGMLFLLIFSYIPMIGIIIAFKDYRISEGILGFFTSPWAGLKHFVEFFTEIESGMIIRNTFVISVLKIIFTFPIPILFAIMINEVRNVKFKKFIQTASYLPHFISWVVVYGIMFAFLSGDGVINSLFKAFNLIDSPIPFLTDPKKFWTLAIISDAWKEFGWWSIIFIAAIVGIDQSIFEAADIDGASRLQKIRYITLPGIKSTINVVLILSLGNLLGGGMSGSNFEQSLLLGNNLNRSASEILQTHVLKAGLVQLRYSYAAAVGLLQSIVSVTMIFGSNGIVKKISGTGIY